MSKIVFSTFLMEVLINARHVKEDITWPMRTAVQMDITGIKQQINVLLFYSMMEPPIQTNLNALYTILKQRNALVVLMVTTLQMTDVVKTVMFGFLVVKAFLQLKVSQIAFNGVMII